VYRFSLSWPRLYPKGNAREFNQDAVNYYNRLIDTLKENGIEPYVSIRVDKNCHRKLIIYSIIIYRISTRYHYLYFLVIITFEKDSEQSLVYLIPCS
jgi:hypothetical protein